MPQVNVSPLFRIKNGSSIQDYKFGYIELLENDNTLLFSYATIMMNGEKRGLIFENRENVFFVTSLSGTTAHIISLHYSIDDILEKYNESEEIKNLCSEMKEMIEVYNDSVDNKYEKFKNGINRKEK